MRRGFWHCTFNFAWLLGRVPIVDERRGHLWSSLSENEGLSASSVYSTNASLKLDVTVDVRVGGSHQSPMYSFLHSIPLIL